MPILLKITLLTWWLFLIRWWPWVLHSRHKGIILTIYWACILTMRESKRRLQRKKKENKYRTYINKLKRLRPLIMHRKDLRIRCWKLSKRFCIKPNMRKFNKHMSMKINRWFLHEQIINPITIITIHNRQTTYSHCHYDNRRKLSRIKRHFSNKKIMLQNLSK